MEQPDKRIGGGPERPKISSEKIDQYMAEIDTILKIEVNLALRGYENGEGSYAPWSLDDVKKACDSILTFLNQKVILYTRAEMSDKAAEAQKQSDTVKEVISELLSVPEVPEGFLQKLKDTVDAKLNAEE